MGQSKDEVPVDGVDPLGRFQGGVPALLWDPVVADIRKDVIPGNVPASEKAFTDGVVRVHSQVPSSYRVSVKDTSSETV